MTTVIAQRELKARKQHHCDTCRTPIETGEQYLRSTNTSSGRVWTWKEHPECHTVGVRSMQFWDEEYDYESTREYLADIEGKMKVDEMVVARRMGLTNVDD